MRGTIPAKPEDYKPDLGDLKLPEGREIDTKDPRFVGLQKIAHESGMSTEAFNKILRMEAQAVVDSAATFAANVEAGRKERNAQLGENGAAEIEALEKWVEAQWPKPEEAEQIKAVMWTPFIVRTFQQIQKILTDQGVHGFTQAGRESAARDDGKPNGWDNLSSVDRRTWQLEENRRVAAKNYAQ